MNRIFFSLALASMTFMAATLLIGLSLGDVRDATDRVTQQWATVHRLCGMLAAIGMVFVHCVVVTYFVGTSRWCKEVVETYQLPAELALRSARLKRSTFPWAVMCMLSVVGVSALGGASDPAAALELAPFLGVHWSHWHLTGALLAMAFIGYAFTVEWTHIQANSQIIQEIMQEVRRIRTERGLDVAEPVS